MNIKTLQLTSTEEIRHSFNEAFKEYFVPLQLSAEQMEQKLLAEGFDPSISAGAFDESRLGGFILHSSGMHAGKRTVYNSGTGIVAAYRGQGLVQEMYEYLLPLLRERGYEKSLLEVIQENTVARRRYEAVGFQVLRELHSFKGEVTGPVLNPEVMEIRELHWALLQSYWNWQPSWQHSLECLQRAAASYKTYGIYKEEQLAAYVVVNPITNRIPSFATAQGWRNKGLATALFRHVQQLRPQMPLTVINMASHDVESIGFLLKTGLKPLLKQYEMELNLRQQA
ncbi:GNAT family N-acetyltransferase [Cesiribacter sp. SM1]|uniref:GNAT family N-acetyltransferase n=1 Tax=Cesiribacter sp. SM1 TaxID=2861196 RepID=UPI001CD6F5EE|nr:GNAT family N-acetyltransferase [Cesiribacter sp. SM1]